ncbi:MAG: glycosyltransferase family 8 protein [Ramlibacter sp.]|nr:glycosyltransferase family 8 protein [Ramlibacter sp.]
MTETEQNRVARATSNARPMEMAFASDARYFPGLILALASVLANTSDLQGARIHVLDGGLTASQRARLEKVARRNPDVSLLIHRLEMGRLNGVRLLNGSALTYARLLLPDLLPGADEIMYLDVDVLYENDLLRLWQTSFAGHSVLAVQDAFVKLQANDNPWLDAKAPEAQAPYFNAGVLKIDLAAWRREGTAASALELAQTEPEKCRFWDQTPLNNLLRGKCQWLAPDFNYQLVTGSPEADAPEYLRKNMHYVGQFKPWLSYSHLSSFEHWRRRYRDLVGFPDYMFNYRFWSSYALPAWKQSIRSSPLFPPLCRFMLATGLHTVIPGVNRRTLELGAKSDG